MKSFALALVFSLGLFAGCKPSAPAGDSGTPSAGSASSKQLTIAFMPKSKGNAYFIACRAGAEQAAKDLNVKLLYDGPTETDPAKQNEIVETWITRGVDVIAAACENREGISTALRKAQAKAGNMIEWQKAIEKRNAEKYPNMKRVALRPCDDLRDKAFSEATAIMNANPSVKLLMNICSPSVPGAAEAVKQAGKVGAVKVIGLGLPSENRAFVKEGVTDTVILWKVQDLGYLTIEAAAALARGELKAGAKTFKSKRAGDVEIQGDNILLGKPFLFTKENIDQFDF